MAKEWIRSVLFSDRKPQKNKVDVSYILPGVFYNAPQSSLVTSLPGLVNTRPYKVCLNSISLLFNYGYSAIKTMKESMNLPGLREHGLKNKTSNRKVQRQEEYAEMETSLHDFFEVLKGEAETHATRIIREAAGVALRDEEVDLVELPSSWSKRRIYYRYCYTRGYSVRSDAKGSMPKVKDFNLREFDDDWPEGSEPGMVCSWIYFRKFWKKHYPKVMIRPPSHDTCGECWKYKNALGTTSRIINTANRERIRSTLVDEINNPENDILHDDKMPVQEKAVDGEENAVYEATAAFQHNATDTVRANLNKTVEANAVNGVTSSEKVNADNNRTNSKDYTSLIPDSLLQEKVMSDVVDLLQEEDEFAPPAILAEESLVSKYQAHVNQFALMREHVKTITKKAKEDAEKNTPWSQRMVVQIADFAQNLDMPHFGGEQPGDTYYFSPLGIYLFGIVSPYIHSSNLLCQYFTEGEGAKGGNNVASMLWNNFKQEGFIERMEAGESMGEYAIVMDNCAGQNKNRMVIRFLMLMTEIGLFKKASNVYLVRGHTKNACDRCFMLLKQHFHYKNVYTMEQLNKNLNQNDGVTAIEIKSNKFFDFDKLLDNFYKRPEAGTVTRTHIFSMNQDEPGILKVQDDISSDVRVQNLRKGNQSNTDRKRMILQSLKEMNPMPKPGIKPIKQVELGSKWRPLVPEEFRDDVCPIPPKDLVEKFKASKRNKGRTGTTNRERNDAEKSPLEKMSKKELQDELAKFKLSKSGNKPVLIQRLKTAIANKNSDDKTAAPVLKLV